MDSQKEWKLFYEMSKLNPGTRRRLLRRTTKKYKESLKQWQKWRDSTEFIDAQKYNPDAYKKTVELWEMIEFMRKQIIWFNEAPASKFIKVNNPERWYSTC